MQRQITPKQDRSIEAVSLSPEPVGWKIGEPLPARRGVGKPVIEAITGKYEFVQQVSIDRGIDPNCCD
jgi:hypothetical protein